MDWILTRPIAHRGLHNHGRAIPENSLQAFAAAIAHNHPIELDVHLLEDGEIVVFHDCDLHRMTGCAGELSTHTAQTIQQFRLLNTDQRIPLFRDVLAFIQGRVPLLIEIKNFHGVGPLETAIIRALAHYSGDYAVQSFNPFVIAWFKHHAPHILRGQLATGIPHGAIDKFHYFVQKNFLLNWLSAPHFLAFDIQSLPHFPIRIARHCLNTPILAWTIKNQEEYIKAWQYADNIIFDQFLSVDRDLMLTNTVAQGYYSHS